MFNISGVELAVIAIAALLLLGPQRLPEVARSLGKFLREFRRQTDDVRTMVEREFYQMDQEIKKVVEPVTDAVHEATADATTGQTPTVESGPPTALLPPTGTTSVEAPSSAPTGTTSGEAPSSAPSGVTSGEAPSSAPSGVTSGEAPSSAPSGVTGELYDAEYHAAEANGLLPPSTEAHPDALSDSSESTQPNPPEHRASEPQTAAEQEPTARAK